MVHDYGDVCQAITELGVERKVAVTTNEFRTLNRCLDNAIADAVTAYASGFNASMTDQSAKATELNAVALERQLQLIDMSIQVLNTVRGGHVGLNGPTSAVLARSLKELRELTQQLQPEIAPTLRTVPPPRR